MLYNGFAMRAMPDWVADLEFQNGQLSSRALATDHPCEKEKGGKSRG